MDITSWISAISTLVLVVITAYYAFITKKLMMYQKDVTLLEYRPFLKPESIIHKRYLDQTSNAVQGVKVGVLFTNVGRVLLEFQMLKFHVSINSKTNDNNFFLNNGGYIYPGENNEFMFAAITVDKDIKDVIEGRLEYELVYFSNNGNKYRSYRKYAFFFYNNYEYVEWRTLEQEETELV